MKAAKRQRDNEKNAMMTDRMRVQTQKTNWPPLTPVPAVTAHDEHWPLCHFWRHHLWSKLASSMLNFCRRKRFYQRYPDQSDWPNGAWDIHKNAEKVEWKTQNKISCNYNVATTWSMVKNIRLDDAFSEVFKLEASPVDASSGVQKKWEKEKKERWQRK